MKKINTQTPSPAPVWAPQPAALHFTSDHQVDIWRIHLNLPIDSLRILEGMLSTNESDRAARFYFPADRDRFIVSHGSLRDILARYLHSGPNQLSFSVNAYGKPSLDQGQLEFNLSHSGDFALIAITQGHKIGVDVERVRTGISADIIGGRFFSRTEMSELRALPPEQRETAFFICWTRKEAYIKAQGLGLSLPLDSFDVSLTPDQPAVLRATRPAPGEAARWTLLSLKVGPGHEAAVAVDGQNLEFRLWDWEPGRISPP
jgi:4'-phosphopantetheinyl transferase